jgi:hypothetical protein
VLKFGTSSDRNKVPYKKQICLGEVLKIVTPHVHTVDISIGVRIGIDGFATPAYAIKL